MLLNSIIYYHIDIKSAWGGVDGFDGALGGGEAVGDGEVAGHGIASAKHIVICIGQLAFCNRQDISHLK